MHFVRYILFYDYPETGEVIGLRVALPFVPVDRGVCYIA